MSRRISSRKRPLVEERDYRALAEFRHQIQRYLEFSEGAAIAAGIEPRQYQLMLSIKGLPLGAEPTVGTLAERMRIRHHSTVELVNRAERNGFVVREQGSRGRQINVRLTSRGLKVLERAVVERLEELQSAGPILVNVLGRLLRSEGKQKRVARSGNALERTSRQRD